MKNHHLFVGILILSLCIGSLPLSYAAITDKISAPLPSAANDKLDEAKKQLTDLANANLDEIKKVLDRALNAIIVALDQARQTLNEFPPSDANQQAINLINETIAYLEGQQVKIATAGSIEELRNIQKQTIQYIKDHQEAITTAIVASCDEAYWQTVEMMQAYLELVQYESRALLAIGEIDQATFDQVASKSQTATDKLDQSTALYTEGSQNNDAAKKAQAIKLLAETGQLIMEIQDLLLT